MFERDDITDNKYNLKERNNNKIEKIAMVPHQNIVTA